MPLLRFMLWIMSPGCNWLACWAQRPSLATSVVAVVAQPAKLLGFCCRNGTLSSGRAGWRVISITTLDTAYHNLVSVNSTDSALTHITSIKDVHQHHIVWWNFHHYNRTLERFQGWNCRRTCPSGQTCMHQSSTTCNTACASEPDSTDSTSFVDSLRRPVL